MGDLFGSGGPQVPQASTIPTAKDTQLEGSVAKEAARRRLAQQQGRGATILTGSQGVQGDDSTGIATKRLLGG